nr:myelin protein zero-like protein 2 [Nerophis lumbriciformis]
MATRVAHVSGIEIYAPPLIEAVNGTTVKLKCTFRSSHPVSAQSVSVSWNFRAPDSKTEESVFYYQETAHPPPSGRFKGHAVWSGDIARNDASITLHEVPPTFNGTYICSVRNRPDVHGNNPETVLRVVAQASLSEISILVIAVVASCVFILILLGIFVAVKVYKRRRKGEAEDEDLEMNPREPKRKDPTVCKPEEAVHLTVVEEKLEVDSSDDEESEPSSGDDDDEDGSEEEDDDDDDDDDDYDDDDD